MVVPGHVNNLLGLGKASWIRWLLAFYKFSRLVRMDGVVRSIILPPAYKKQIQALDIDPS